MCTHRTWDESQSPQWKYLLQKESMLKRGGRKTAARLRRETHDDTIRYPSFKTVQKKEDKFYKRLKEEKEKKDSSLSPPTSS